MKVALVYDRIKKWGGAERVLLALHKIFPNAPLFTSVYNERTTKWAEVFDIKTSFLQNFPFAKTSHELYALLMPIAFESFQFDYYDVVISITSEAAKGIITKPKTLHICFCLTPTRYLWSGYEEYFRLTLSRVLAKPIVSYLRVWDKVAAQRPDYYVAISKNVKSRIKKYYDRESVVIYPPVELASSLSASSVQLKKKKHKQSRSSFALGQQKDRKINANELDARRSSYFLLVSRLSRFTPYKRVDLAIEAANKLSLPLKIIGEGDISHFKKRAGKTIEFLGRLTDEELSYYYKNCVALIFPGIEDFGLVMVEAQAFGAPIIAFRGGGAKEIIVEGKTGEFFDEQTADSLANALEKFEPSRYNREDCIKNTERFSFRRFEKEFRQFFDKAVRKYFKQNELKK